MNRKLQLSYCSVCLNRKFDPNQGIICKLSDKAADFSDTCEHYEVDEAKMKARKETEQEVLSADEVITSLPEEVKAHLRKHQSFGFAFLGGLLIAIFSAIIWAAVSISIQYQIGWMAIGVGFLVGFSVRFFGAGIDKRFGYLGAGIAVLACLLGNLLSQVGFYANQEAIPYLEVLGYLTPSITISILIESFEPIDLFFYGLAGIQGYKFAFRTLPYSLEENMDYTPPMAKLRFPLAAASAVLIGVCWFMVASHSVAEKTNYYESGKVYSKGKLLHGMAEGEWEYYFEEGALGAKGNFSNGLEEGIWEYFDETGMMNSLQQYHKGLLHGINTTYHHPNIISQQGQFNFDRMIGEWTTFSENETVLSKGNYHLDMPDGEWIYNHENGNVYQKGKFEKGEKTGIWMTWDEDGQLTEEVNHISENEVEWITYREPSGTLAVQNGNGTFIAYHPNGKKAVFGNVKNKKMEGNWNFYNEEGMLTSTIQYKLGKGKTQMICDASGYIMVENGSGIFSSFFESGLLEQKGEYSNGMKQGKWTTYYEDEDITVKEIAHYMDDLLDGPFTGYHFNGVKALEGSFMNGRREGRWAWFTMEGNLESEVSFANGKKNGEQVFFNEFDVMIKTEIYKNGELLETILP